MPQKIHYASKDATVCGISLFCDCLISYRPQRTTCRNCLKTAAYAKAIAALKRRHNSGAKTLQMDLFEER